MRAKRKGGMETRRPSKKAAVLFPIPAVILCFLALYLCGCGNAPEEKGEVNRAAETASAFLEACGNLDGEAVSRYFSSTYLENNLVPQPLDREDLVAALGYLESYRIEVDKDVFVEGDRATVLVDLSIQGKGEQEESIVLILQDGEWKVDQFTAMDWTEKPASPEEQLRLEVEEALRDFLIACIDGDTGYIFEHLSPGYRSKYRLEEPWTREEFSGVFGTARSYDFAPGEIKLEEGKAEVDVTIEFGSRGNLETETTRVRLVNLDGKWLVDSFPFFVY